MIEYKRAFLVMAAVLLCGMFGFFLLSAAATSNADMVRGNGVVRQAGSAQAGDPAGVAAGRAEQDFDGTGFAVIGYILGALGIACAIVGMFISARPEKQVGPQDIGQELADLEESRGFRK